MRNHDLESNLAGFAARGASVKAIRPVAAGRRRAVVVEARKVALLGAGGGIGQVGAYVLIIDVYPLI